MKLTKEQVENMLPGQTLTIVCNDASELNSSFLEDVFGPRFVGQSVFKIIGAPLKAQPYLSLLPIVC